LIAPYPLVFEPILKEKVWGGSRLSRFGKQVENKMIGESWELADLAATSASGGGGGEARSTITSGLMKGKTLHDAVNEWARDLMGGIGLSASGGFPLLVKFLDAAENLSVQVHPSPAYAAAHEGAHLKTECWYILDAAPGSVIYKGIRPGVTKASFAAHIKDGSVVNDLVAIPAVVGECHNLPSGTCHALGAGVLVAEVQTPSDTTFRVFDWGRRGRELHIEQALECIDFGPAPAATKLAKGKFSGQLVGTEFFRVYESFLPAGGVVPLGESADGPRVMMVLSGSLSIRAGREEPVPVSAGSTALIPASLVAQSSALAKAGTRVLVVTLR
jgi:mannose-6-phosphate isomerase